MTKPSIEIIDAVNRKVDGSLPALGRIIPGSVVGDKVDVRVFDRYGNPINHNDAIVRDVQMVNGISPYPNDPVLVVSQDSGLLGASLMNPVNYVDID